MAAGAVAMEAGHTIRDVYDRHQEEKRQEQGVEAVNGESEASKYANDWFEKYYHLKEYNTSERGNQLVQEFLQHFQDLSEGLANVNPSRTTFKDTYVQWGHQISSGFRDNILTDLNSSHQDVKSFQEGINAGLIGSGVSNKEAKDAIRLVVPGVYHYLTYDSFWWGLWVLNTLGTTLHRRRKNNE